MIAVGIVLSFLFALRVFSPILADEVVFVKPLELWLQSGPERYGVWHTPFYPWIHYGIAKTALALGFESSQALLIFSTRALGLVCVWIAAYHMIQAVKKLLATETEPKPAVLLWVWGFVALQPLMVGSSQLVDYDNTLLLAASAYFFRLIIEKETRVWKLALALSLCLMGKETTPLAYPLAVWLSDQNRRRGFLRAAAVGVFGFAAFAAVTAIWCWSYGIEYGSVFAMAFLGLHTAGAVGGGAQASLPWQRALWIQIFPIFWVGLAALGLFAISARDHFKQKSTQALLVLMALVILVYTFGLRQMTYHFPKYMVPILVWAPVLAVKQIRQVLIQLDRVSQLLVMIFVPLALGLLSPDPFWVLHERDVRTASITLLAQAVGIALLVGLIRVYFKELAKRDAWVLALFVATLSHSVSYAKQVVLSEGSVTYWYGDRATQDLDLALTGIDRTQVQVISPAEDIAWNLGLEFQSVPMLVQNTKKLCEQATVVATRVREASSLKSAPELSALQSCLGITRVGPDALLGRSALAP